MKVNSEWKREKVKEKKSMWATDVQSSAGTLHFAESGGTECELDSHTITETHLELRVQRGRVAVLRCTQLPSSKSRSGL